jgi:hypothetical protein
MAEMHAELDVQTLQLTPVKPSEQLDWHPVVADAAGLKAGGRRGLLQASEEQVAPPSDGGQPQASEVVLKTP